MCYNATIRGRYGHVLTVYTIYKSDVDWWSRFLLAKKKSQFFWKKCKKKCLYGLYLAPQTYFVKGSLEAFVVPVLKRPNPKFKDDPSLYEGEQPLFLCFG